MTQDGRKEKDKFNFLPDLAQNLNVDSLSDGDTFSSVPRGHVSQTLRRGLLNPHGAKDDAAVGENGGLRNILIDPAESEGESSTGGLPAALPGPQDTESEIEDLQPDEGMDEDGISDVTDSTEAHQKHGKGHGGEAAVKWLWNGSPFERHTIARPVKIFTVNHSP